MYRTIVEANKQKEIAKLPRQDALQKLIIEIIRKEPGSTTQQVLGKLKSREGGSVIEYIHEEENVIAWLTPTHAKESPIASLKDRICRAKKFLNVR